MSDHRQPSSGLTQRRQVCHRISELRSNCDRLIQVRDSLSARLDELNEVVDRLIGEKRSKKYDSQLKNNLTSHNVAIECSKTYKTQHELQTPSSLAAHASAVITTTTTATTIPTVTTTTTTTTITTTADLADNHDSLSRRNSPSDAFKTKLSHCLQEIAPKADEIVKFSEHLHSSSFKR